MNLDQHEAIARDHNLPRGNWGYDDGITDEKTGEQGKPKFVETIHNGRHVLICDPDFTETFAPVTDAIGRHIAAASPDRVLAYIAVAKAAKAMLASIDEDPPIVAFSNVWGRRAKIESTITNLRAALEQLP